MRYGRPRAEIDAINPQSPRESPHRRPLVAAWPRHPTALRRAMRGARWPAKAELSNDVREIVTHALESTRPTDTDRRDGDDEKKQNAFYAQWAAGTR